jgi:hypothetical protein
MHIRGTRNPVLVGPKSIFFSWWDEELSNPAWLDSLETQHKKIANRIKTIVLPFAVSEMDLPDIVYCRVRPKYWTSPRLIVKTIQCEKDQIACARVDPDDGWEDCFEASLLDNNEDERELVEEEDIGSASSNDDN